MWNQDTVLTSVSNINVGSITLHQVALAASVSDVFLAVLTHSPKKNKQNMMAAVVKPPETFDSSLTDDSSFHRVKDTTRTD